MKNGMNQALRDSVRLPGYFEQGLLAGAGETEEIDLVQLVAREADIGGLLLDEMLNRDRLNTAYLRMHTEESKRAGARATRPALGVPPSSTHP